MVPISKKFLLKQQKYFIKKEEDENRYRWNLALKKYSDCYEEEKANSNNVDDNEKNENKASQEEVKSKKDKKCCDCF